MDQQRLQRLRRIVAGDDNPLRRYVDKLESAVVVGLVIGFLLAAPLLAIFAARVAASTSAREVRAQSTWQPVTAVLTQSAGTGLIGLDGEWDTSWVTAQWTAHNGTHHHGLVAVGLSARAGQHVTLYATPWGQLTPPPLTRSAVIEREALAGIAVPVGLGVLLLITACGVRVLANRRRMASWAKEWEATGPRWSSLR